MARLLTIIVALVVVGMMAGSGFAVEKAASGNPQTLCPVLQGPVNKNVYTDYEGQRIYFCCSPCIEQFKKEPGKYLKKMNEAGVTPEASPGTKGK
jgi:YHS domain-containing protein